MVVKPKKRETKRRGHGEGSIFQRDDGRWVAKITIGYDASGKRRRKTVYGKSKKEVQDKLTDLQHRKTLGTVPDAAGVKVVEYLNRWLEDVVRVTVAEATYERYKQLARLHINPRIGGIRLDRLTTTDVQRIYSEMEQAGSSPRTRRFVHSVLREAVQQAADWGMVSRNVCDLAKPPKISRKEMKTFNAKEAASFLVSAKTERLYAMYVLALTTGMRQGELFALQWGDIDLDARLLQVRRTVTYNDKIKEPKTAKGKRRIDLPPMAVTSLQDHRKRMLADGLAGSSWVFSNAKGGLLSRHNLSRSFNRILKTAGMPRIRFHDLRHTSVSLMLAEGINPKHVSEMHGHASVAFTLDVYGHVMPGTGKEAADKMHRLLTATAS